MFYRIVRKLITIFIIIVLFITPSFANSNFEKIKVVKNEVNLEVNGTRVYVDNFLYNGVTYIPLRAVSEMLNKNVVWDATSNIVSINSKLEKNEALTSNKSNSTVKLKEGLTEIDVVRNKANLEVNGNKVNVDNFLYQDITYVPLRIISEMLNRAVSWKVDTKTVNIEDKTLPNIQYYSDEEEQEYYDLWNKFKEGDIKEAYEGFKTWADTKPYDNFISFCLGRILYEMKEYDEAILYLNKSLIDENREYRKVLSNFYLGNCNLKINKYDYAKEYFEKTIEVANYVTSPDVYYEEREKAKEILSSTKLVFSDEFKNWTKKETEHIIFYFQPNNKITDINKFIEDKEETFQKINSIFNAQLDKKIVLFKWNSDDDAMTVIGRGLSFAIPDSLTVHEEYKASDGHELTHIIVGNIEGKTEQSGLINEGIASYYDQSGRDRLEATRNGIKETGMKELSVKELWLNWPGEFIGDFQTYNLACAFVDYLIELEGMDKLLELAKNQTYENAKVIYGNNIDKYISDFEEIIFK